MECSMATMTWEIVISVLLFLCVAAMIGILAFAVYHLFREDL